MDEMFLVRWLAYIGLVTTLFWVLIMAIIFLRVVQAMKNRKENNDGVDPD